MGIVWRIVVGIEVFDSQGHLGTWPSTTLDATRSTNSNATFGQHNGARYDERDDNNQYWKWRHDAIYGEIARIILIQQLNSFTSRQRPDQNPSCPS
jgi:hypothetical protein